MGLNSTIMRNFNYIYIIFFLIYFLVVLIIFSCFYNDRDYTLHLYVEATGIFISFIILVGIVERHNRMYWLRIKPILSKVLKRNLYEILLKLNLHMPETIDSNNTVVACITKKKTFDEIEISQIASDFENAAKEFNNSCVPNMESNEDTLDAHRISDILVNYYDDISLNLHDIKYFIFPIIVLHSRDENMTNSFVQLSQDIMILDSAIKSYKRRSKKDIRQEMAHLLSSLSSLAIV